MSAKWLLVLLVSTPLLLSAQQDFTEQQVISYAKALDVAKLDPSLSSQSLDQWMRFGPAHLDKVTWEMSECDLKPDFSNPNYVGPLCAKVRFMRGNCAGWAIITVGNFRDGISGSPHLIYIFAAVGSNFDSPPESNKLSDLPRLLEEASSSPASGRAPTYKPSCSYTPNPPYSQEAKDAKFEGTIRVEAIVLPDGSLIDVRIVNSPGIGLDKSIIETLKTWKCIPAIHNGKLVPTKIPIELTFRLKPKPNS